MILLTEELEKRFAEVGDQDGKGGDALVIARFFTPDSGWTWYATEYVPADRVFFGYVCGIEDEWGYFSLDEMESVRGPLGLGIERDLHFTEKPLRAALKADGKSYPRTLDEIHQQRLAADEAPKPAPGPGRTSGPPEPAPYDDISPSGTVLPCGCEAEEDGEGRLVITCLCDMHFEQRAVE